MTGQYLLLVDNDPITRKGMTDKLDPAGYRTVTINTASEAVAALRQVRPAAVVIDVDTADLADSNLAALVNEWHIPLIVTGDVEAGLIWAREHGAAFVAQPVNERTLHSVIERAISSQDWD